MKKYILIPVLLLILIISGCTAVDPGFVVVIDDPPVDVLLDDDSKTQVVDSDGDIITIDEITRAITTIEFEHHEIHEGDSYLSCDVTDVGNGDNRTLLLITPNTTKWIHLLWIIEHELEASVTFYEDTVTSANGTLTIPINRNRNLTNTAGLLVYRMPTIVDSGTELCKTQGGSGRQEGGEDRGVNEYILKPNTKYTLTVVNETANNNVITIQIDWYEHTSKD